jgi:lipoprotein-anchoring transpeptidase ErfK/SrfK
MRPASYTNKPRAQPKVKKVIKVDLTAQVVEAYEGKEKIFRFDCVSGDSEHPTDKGRFKIFKKREKYRSNAYNVQMNYAMFFTADGKALHQYHGPMPLNVVRSMRNRVSDWFGSHGCVRMREEDARALFNWTPMYTAVEVF